jgi:hypothetical protein
MHLLLKKISMIGSFFLLRDDPSHEAGNDKQDPHLYPPIQTDAFKLLRGLKRLLEIFSQG